MNECTCQEEGENCKNSKCECYYYGKECNEMCHCENC